MISSKHSSMNKASSHASTLGAQPRPAEQAPAKYPGLLDTMGSRIR